MGRLGRFLSAVRFTIGAPIFSASSSSPSPSSSSTTYSVIRDGALSKVWPKCSSKTMERILTPPKRPNLPNPGFRRSAGISVVAGSICLWSIQAEAIDEDQELRHGDELQNEKKDVHGLWRIVRRFEIAVALFLMVFTDWNNPIILVVNFLLFLCCSCPRPYSVYIFIEQLRKRATHDEHLEVSSKTKFFPAKKVDIQDYKLFCTAQVELADQKLGLIGILGSWWTLHCSS